MYKNIHMMGIGGIGMSGIAQLLLQQGARISGCDIMPNSLTEKLALGGADIFAGHSPGHISPHQKFWCGDISSSIDLVIHSTAIKEDNPELQQAQRAGIPVWKRAQMLAELVRGKQCIAVTGTHGKTTVSGMIAHILNEAGLDPSFVIGGEIHSLGGNARWGKGRYFVAEADESDGSHIYLKPEIAVITNIDRDHLEYYSGLSQITSVMKRFVEGISRSGIIVGCGEDVLVKEILNGLDIEAISYGLSPLQDLYAGHLYQGEWQSQFDVIYQGTFLCTVTLNIPGRHNVLNALAAVAVALKAGVAPFHIRDALSRYSGVKRRLDVVFRNDEITIVDDYAHHPTEIRAVLDTVRRTVKGRLIGIFQPHRFTRTKFLAPEFGPVFRDLDMLILTDIYSAGETPLPGIDERLIYNEVVKQGRPEVMYMGLEGIVDFLGNYVKPGDTVVVMGAGDITNVAHKLSENLKECVYG